MLIYPSKETKKAEDYDTLNHPKSFLWA